MSTANLTLTGTLGPDRDVVAQLFQNVKGINFQIDRNVLSITLSDGRIVDYDYAITATITYTIASGVGTVTIS